MTRICFTPLTHFSTAQLSHAFVCCHSLVALAFTNFNSDRSRRPQSSLVRFTSGRLSVTSSPKPIFHKNFLFSVGKLCNLFEIRRFDY